MRRFFRRGAGTEAEAGLGRGAAPGFPVYLTFGEYRMRFGNVNQTSLLPLRSPFAIFAKCKDSW